MPATSPSATARPGNPTSATPVSLKYELHRELYHYFYNITRVTRCPHFAKSCLRQHGTRRSSVCGFSARSAEKPHTNRNQVPQLPSDVEGLPKAKNADCVSRVISQQPQIDPKEAQKMPKSEIHLPINYEYFTRAVAQSNRSSSGGVSRTSLACVCSEFEQLTEHLRRLAEPV